MATIGQAKNDLREIGNEIGQRIRKVRESNPEMSEIDFAIQRPDLVLEAATFNRCWLAVDD